MAGDIATMAPELVLFAGALVLLVGGSFTPRRRQRWLRRAGAVLALVSSGLGGWGLSGGAAMAFEGTFTADDAQGAVRVVVGVVLALVLVLAGDELLDHPRESDTTALLLIGGAGTLLLAGATDLALLIVAFLLSSIPLYAIVAVVRRPLSAEAAMKTYLVGALAGIALMSGTVLLYGVAGATGYVALSEVDPRAAPGLVTAGAVLVAGGLLFKVGGWPAHFWVPDAAQGSATYAAAYLTTVPKVGALVALARLVDVVPGGDLALVVAVAAAVSMTLGNLAAFFQDDPARLLGWSTVSQVGYLLVPVAVVAQVSQALPALLVFVAAYAVTNVGAFAVVGAHPYLRLAGWVGLGRRRPVLAAALVVLLLGLVGTPPTGVFVGKLLAVVVAWDSAWRWLAVLLLVNTVASLFYYLRWLAPVVGLAPADSGGEDEEDGPAREPGRAAAPVAVLCAVLALATGVTAGAAWDVVGLARLG